MKVKEESEKAGLKHSENYDRGIQSHHFMANRWKSNGNRDFILGGSKSTADGDFSHEIKRLTLVRKATTNLDSILKAETLLC